MILLSESPKAIGTDRPTFPGESLPSLRWIGPAVGGGLTDASGLGATGLILGELAIGALAAGT